MCIVDFNHFALGNLHAMYEIPPNFHRMSHELKNVTFQIPYQNVIAHIQ